MAKRLTAIVLFFIILLAICGCAENKKRDLEPTKEFLVNDFAELLTDQDFQSVYSQGIALQEKASVQVVAVTTGDLHGDNIKDYADDILKDWDVGGEEENGIVILLVESEANFAVSVGRGLSEFLTKEKLQAIIDTAAAPHLLSKEFSKAVVDVYASVANEVYSARGIEPAQDTVPVAVLPQTSQPEQEKSDNVLLAWIIMIAIIIIYVLIFGRRCMFIFGSPKIFEKFQFHSFGKKADNK